MTTKNNDDKMELLLRRAEQMQKEQSVHPDIAYSKFQGGVLEGISRVVMLIRRHVNK
jgi:hypothetical protein